jgi:hypothetical protein
MIAITWRADGGLHSHCRPITYHCKGITTRVKFCKSDTMPAMDLQSLYRAGAGFA